MLNQSFNSIIELITAFPTEESCLVYLEELLWGGKPVSPFDPESKVYKTSTPHRYKCKTTNRYFNVLKGTMFEGKHLSLQQWFLAIWLLTCKNKGISSPELAKAIGCKQKAAWKLMMKVRKCYGLKKMKPEMKDNTQMDEAMVGGKNKNRHYNKKIANCQGRAAADKSKVFGMHSDGKVLAFVVETTGPADIQPIIFEHVEPCTTIITDEWAAYKGLDRYYDHQEVIHGSKQYVNDCGFTTNAIEGFWTWIKKSVTCVYHWVSRKHLQKYIDEIMFHFNYREVSNNEKFNLVLSSCKHS